MSVNRGHWCIKCFVVSRGKHKRSPSNYIKCEPGQLEEKLIAYLAEKEACMLLVCYIAYIQYKPLFQVVIYVLVNNRCILLYLNNNSNMEIPN